MVREFFLDVAEQVDSGEYFSDAKSWYHTKYSFPIIERSFCILFCTLSILISFISFITVSGFFPLSKSVPLAINISDQANNFSVLRKISQNKTTNPNVALQRYLLKQFILSYEVFTKEKNTKKLEKNNNYIAQFSNKKIRKNYRELISLQNPNSYLIRYRNGNRNITLDHSSVVLSYSPKEQDTKKLNEYSATINFTIEEFFSTRNRAKNITNAKATIEYTYKDQSYDEDEQNFAPIKFQITNYKVTER